MSPSCPLADSLPAEHRVLCREYAAVQARCSRLIAQQQAEIEHLKAQVVCLRAAAIVQVSALAFAREDHAALQRSIPGLPRRVVLARHIEALQAAGVDALRLSPQTGDFAALCAGYADRMSGALSADALIAQLAGRGRPLSDGFVSGTFGKDWSGSK